MSAGPIQTGRIVATIEALRLPDGMAVDRLEIELDSATFDPKTRTPSLPNGATARGYLSAKGILFALQDQMPPMITGLDVTLEPGKIVVECRVRVLLEIPVRAQLGLNVVDESELHVGLIDVDKGGPVPGLIQNQLNSVNPVFKTSDLPFPFAIKKVEIRGDFVVLTGTGTL